MARSRTIRPAGLTSSRRPAARGARLLGDPSQANRQHRPVAAGVGQHATRTWTPYGHPGAWQTFGIRPYWRKATCAEVDCSHWRQGWVTAVDETTDLGRRQADYFRSGASGRSYTEARTDAGWTAFEFHSGQQCFGFGQHQVPWDRPELYVVQAGDWRAAAGPARVYDRGDQWADDLHTHVDRIATARSRAGTAGN